MYDDRLSSGQRDEQPYKQPTNQTNIWPFQIFLIDYFHLFDLEFDTI